MALISCPECSKSISDQSVSCPNCGFPTPKFETFNRHAPPPLQQVDYDDNNSLASSRQRQKSSGCSNATIFLFVGIFVIGSWLIKGYNYHTEQTKQYSEAQSGFHEESPQVQVQESVFDSPLTQIPMLLSGSGEDGRYFLISHFASYGIENVKYARRGNESDSYGEMQIDCSNHKIRKISSDNLKALESVDLGDWYTPTPDWTDQDIVNFICK